MSAFQLVNQKEAGRTLALHYSASELHTGQQVDVPFPPVHQGDDDETVKASKGGRAACSLFRVSGRFLFWRGHLLVFLLATDPSSELFRST